MKVALALHHGQIPASLHFVQPNPAIPWQDIPLQVPTALVPWPRGAVPRLAAVNAFGIGGTNAHAVLEEAPTAIAMWDAIAEPSSNPAAAVPHHVLLLSAEATEALVQRARDVGDFLARRQACGDSAALGDLCHTAAVRRTHHEHRLAVMPRRDARELRTRAASLPMRQPSEFRDAGCRRAQCRCGSRRA